TVAPTELSTLSLHDALPISGTQFVVTIGHNDRRAQEFGICHLAGDKLAPDQVVKLLRILFQATDIGRPAGHIGRPDGLVGLLGALDRKSTRLNSSHVKISYAVFCLKKKKQQAYPREA